MQTFAEISREVCLRLENKRPISLAVFGSGTGTNLEALLNHQKQTSLFDIEIVVTDRPCRCLEIAGVHDIPIIFHSYSEFRAHYSGMNLRESYDTNTVALIDTHCVQNKSTIDLVVLAGYMRLISTPLLNYFNHRIINIHPADLEIKDVSGRRLYIGTNAVYEALIAGEKRTRSTIIQVNEKVDDGPILGFGPWVDYLEGNPVTEEKARIHQNKQKHESDWPGLIQVIEKIARGEVQL